MVSAASPSKRRHRRDDRDDHAVLHRDVADEAIGAGAVDDRAAGDLQVVHARTPWNSQTKSSSMFARFRPNTKAFGISSISVPGASGATPTLRTSSSKNTRISRRAERCAQAEVGAEAESDVRVGLAGHVEALRIVEVRRITVGRRVHQHHLLTLADRACRGARSRGWRRGTCSRSA